MRVFFINPKVKTQHEITAVSIKGDISVSNKIVLGSKSEISGDLTYRSLIIEDGAQFQGSCSVIGNKDDAVATPINDELKPRFTMASSSSDSNA